MKLEKRFNFSKKELRKTNISLAHRQQPRSESEDKYANNASTNNPYNITKKGLNRSVDLKPLGTNNNNDNDNNNDDNNNGFILTQSERSERMNMLNSSQDSSQLNIKIPSKPKLIR